MGAAPGYTASTCLRAGSSSPNPLPGHLFSCRLFPLREPGVNWHAKPLTLREVEVSQALAVAGGGRWGGLGKPRLFRDRVTSDSRH